MKQTFLALTGTAALVALFLAVPASAQKVAGGGDGGAKSAPAPAAPAPSAPSGGGASSGSSGGGYSGGGYRGGRDNDGGSRRDGSTGSSGYSAPRGGSSGASGASGKDSGKGSSGGNAGGSGGYSGGTVGTAVERGGRKTGGDPNGKATNTTGDGVPAYSRPRDGNEPVGTAVPRGTTPRPPTGTTGIFIPGGYYGGYGYYDPWGYSSGYGYYGGYYDPWYGGYPTYPVGGFTSNDDEGALRLKIKPREAEVYVDGYFVGVVDDFDGIFQRLHLDSGPHRIEVRAPGYETLEFEVRITPDHTTTYKGELKKIQ